MTERIFFISPLPESEEEKKAYYDKYGNTTTTSYKEQPAHPQEQPKEDINTENRIIIIYEAPQPKVLTEQNQAPEAIPTIPTPEQIPTADLYPQPAEHTARTRTTTKDLLTMIYGPQAPYSQTLGNIYGEQSPTETNQLASIRSELQEITSAPGAPTSQAGELAPAA